MIALSLILTAYILGGIFSPFPYWPTYLALWKHALFDKNPYIGWYTRVRQVRFLAKYALLSPVWTALWYLDELLFPAYRRQSVRPLFIIGQPRSGTTLLHRSLAADEENFFAIRHIEWRYPYIILQKLIEALNLTQKLKQISYWPSTQTGKEASIMHPNTLYDWEEDGIFYEECYLHHFFVFLRFPYPELLTYLDDYPALPHRVKERILATHRKVIQKVMYLRGASGLHYLSKEVTSHNKITRLLDLYPEARFLLIARPSSEFMNSLLALVRKSTLVKTGIDPITIPGWESALIQRMHNDSNLLAELCEQRIDADLQMQISYNGFTSDIVKTVRYFYDWMGLTPSNAYIKHLETLNNKQRHRDRGYTYKQQSFAGFEQYEEFVQAVVVRFDELIGSP